MMDFSSDVYSRTGSSLLDSIAIVHPFIISVLIGRISEVVNHVGEVCTILMDKGDLKFYIQGGPEISHSRGS